MRSKSWFLSWPRLTISFSHIPIRLQDFTRFAPYAATHKMSYLYFDKCTRWWKYPRGLVALKCRPCNQCGQSSPVHFKRMHHDLSHPNQVQSVNVQTSWHFLQFRFKVGLKNRIQVTTDMMKSSACTTKKESKMRIRAFPVSLFF